MVEFGFRRPCAGIERSRLAAVHGGRFMVQVFALEPFRAHVETMAVLGGELVVAEHLPVQFDGRGHAFDAQLVECAPHTGHGGLAAMCGHDELAHHRVELRRDRVSFDYAGIHPHAGSAGHCTRSSVPELGVRFVFGPRW